MDDLLHLAQRMMLRTPRWMMRSPTFCRRPLDRLGSVM